VGMQPCADLALTRAYPDARAEWPRRREANIAAC
jgi:hypothetical protein